jgi:hypothetical protein
MKQMLMKNPVKTKKIIKEEKRKKKKKRKKKLLLVLKKGNLRSASKSISISLVGLR